MKKVLILSYFYPPSVFVGGQRTAFWAKELHHFGYYPIIVTRNWNDGQTTLTDKVSDNSLKVETYDTYEIHRVPFKQSLRDRLADKPRMKVFQKALTFWELIASNFSISALPYSNLYPYCDQLLQDGDFTALIASGRPFQTFHIGHRLKKKHDILWMPDFRDEWNSHYRTQPTGLLRKAIAFLERKSEKKWISNANCFTTVSDGGLKRLEAFSGKQGFVVQNGYDAIHSERKPSATKLKMLYAGTLYPYQDIRQVTEVIRNIDNPNLEFYFIGSCVSPETYQYMQALAQEAPQRIHIIDKMPKSEFEQLIDEMDIGVLLPYKNLDGCLPVKIFDYYAHGLDLLLCPSDNDLMEKFIHDTKSGAVVASKEDLINYLTDRLESLKTGKKILERDYTLGKIYHRLHQTELLAKTLDSHSN